MVLLTIHAEVWSVLVIAALGKCYRFILTIEIFFGEASYNIVTDRPRQPPPMRSNISSHLRPPTQFRASGLICTTIFAKSERRSQLIELHWLVGGGNLAPLH